MGRSIQFLLGALACLASLGAAPPVIRVVEFEGITVTGATANRITRAVDEAEAGGEDLVLIQLDTPGGLVSAMDEIVKRMLASKVPIVVWVGPSGARAASAGFFIMIAADVAAMAPGTRCGAASVVYGPGSENKDEDVGLRKANQDLAALLRSIAEKRGRNVEAAEKAVFSADAWSETEAREAGLIELVARDREDLLSQLDGREIRRFDGSTVVLETEGARLVATEHGFRQKLFEFIATPIVAYVLLMLGLAGLYVELSHPGMVFPGVVGALSLILFAFAVQQLPVSTVGGLLIALGIVMLILEVKVASYGMLTLGGTVCLVIGSMMLFKGPIPELRVPLAVVIPSALAMAGFCAVAVRLAVRAQRGRVVTGREGLAGEVGTVIEELSPSGKVFVHGELWNATAAAGSSLPVGSRVRVARVEDMMLVVEPADGRAAGGG